MRESCIFFILSKTWEGKCENLGISGEENRTKQWGFYLLWSHSEPIIIVLRSLEKTYTFLIVDQILLCTFHLFKILVILAETSMHLVVLAANSIFTEDKDYPVGMDFKRRCRNHIYILKFHACLWFFWVYAPFYAVPAFTLQEIAFFWKKIIWILFPQKYVHVWSVKQVGYKRKYIYTKQSVQHFRGCLSRAATFLCSFVVSSHGKHIFYCNLIWPKRRPGQWRGYQLLHERQTISWFLAQTLLIFIATREGN